MFKNYIVITFRNFLKNKNYAFINILGLSIGITCCIVIYLVINYDLQFDKFHSKAENIYQVVRDSENASGTEHSDVTPYPFANAFRNDFSDVPLVTQIHDDDETLVSFGSEKQMLKDVLFADSLFFEVFDFQVVEGNPRKDLAEPGKVFFTESTAAKLFKEKKRATIKLKNILEAEVVGIIKDPPPNSHIQFSMIVSMPSLSEKYLGLGIDQWGLNSSGYSYIVLPENMSTADVQNRFVSFVDKYYSKDDKRQTYKLQPLKAVHFDSTYNEYAVSKNNLIVLGVLGIFILSIACVNFINLATALAVKKSKEIGIRKTLGAVRTQLTMYFLGETFIITLFAVLLSLGIIEWTLPFISHFVEKELTLNLFSDIGLTVFLIALLAFVTVFSGLYPGLILSGFNPVAVLKNKMSAQGSSGSAVRKALVVFQFMIAQALIIGTLVVSDQMSYFRSKPLGFTKDAIINVAMPDHKQSTLRAFQAKLQENSNIQSITYSTGAPVSNNGFGTNYRLSEAPKEDVYDVNLKISDSRYGETYGLELVAGRWITEAEEKLADESQPWEDRKYVLVINESGARQLGFENPADIIGKNITLGLNDIDAPVVGVVKDFHTSSLHSAIKPVILLNFPYFYFDAGIKVSAENLPETLSFIEKSWNEVNPDYYFQYSFLDQLIASRYKQEEQTFTLFKIFAALSIFIGCLGLYGLISFMANQKLKEVGIRKVMGASISSIVVLFSTEFVKLILIAFIVAAPVSWYVMREWLQGFQYHIDVHWSVFVIGILSTLLISLVTVSYRSVRAAITNPVDTLRTE